MILRRSFAATTAWMPKMNESSMFSSVGMEGDAERVETSSDAEELKFVAAKAIGANDPDLGEATSVRVADERATA